MIKIRHLCSGVILAMAVAAGLWGRTAQAQDLSYRFVSLSNIQLPEGFEFFFPVGIDGARRVYGTLYLNSGDSSIPFAAVYDDGDFHILGGPGFARTVNERGAAGGSLYDLETGRERAAVFQEGKIKTIPPRAGEYASFVSNLSDNGIALVMSYDQNFVQTLVVYDGGRPIQVPISGSFLDINNRGEISGTTYAEPDGYRGFRFDSRTGKSTILSPISTDTHAWALGINNHGDVVGYSFEFGGVERIGLWDRAASFQVISRKALLSFQPSVIDCW